MLMTSFQHDTSHHLRSATPSLFHLALLPDIPPVYNRNAGSDLASETAFSLTLQEALSSWTCPLLVSYTTGQVEKHVPLDTVVLATYCGGKKKSSSIV